MCVKNSLSYLEDVDGSWLKIVYFLYHWSLLCVIYVSVCQFSFSAPEEKYVKFTLPSKSYLEHIDGSWQDTMRMGVIASIIGYYYMWFFTCLPIFNSLVQIELWQEHSVLKVILRRHWWFVTGYLEDGVILDFMDHHYIWFLRCVPIFSSLV